MSYRLVRVGDADLEIHVSGPPDAASLLVVHHGAPSAATGYPAYTAAAARWGLRLATIRPDDGHASIADPFDDVVDQLMRAARRRGGNGRPNREET
jgi:predicted amidohydrolase